MSQISDLIDEFFPSETVWWSWLVGQFQLKSRNRKIKIGEEHCASHKKRETKADLILISIMKRLPFLHNTTRSDFRHWISRCVWMEKVSAHKRKGTIMCIIRAVMWCRWFHPVWDNLLHSQIMWSTDSRGQKKKNSQRQKTQKQWPRLLWSRLAIVFMLNLADRIA